MNKTDALALLSQEYQWLRSAMERYYKSLSRHDCETGQEFEKSVSNRGLGALASRDEKFKRLSAKIEKASGRELQRALDDAAELIAQLVRAVKRYCHRTAPWTLAREKRVERAVAFLRGYDAGVRAEGKAPAAPSKPEPPKPSAPKPEPPKPAEKPAPKAAEPKPEKPKEAASKPAEKPAPSKPEPPKPAPESASEKVDREPMTWESCTATPPPKGAIRQRLKCCTLVAAKEHGITGEFRFSGLRGRPGSLVVRHGEAQGVFSSSEHHASFGAACRRIQTWVKGLAPKAEAPKEAKAEKMKAIPGHMTLQSYLAGKGLRPEDITFADVKARLLAEYEVPAKTLAEFSRDYSAAIVRSVEAGIVPAPEVLKEQGLTVPQRDEGPAGETLESLASLSDAASVAFLRDVRELPIEDAEKKTAELERKSNKRNKGVGTIFDGERPAGVTSNEAELSRVKTFNKTRRKGEWTAEVKTVKVPFGPKKRNTYYVVHRSDAEAAGKKLAEDYGNLMADELRNRSAVTAERYADVSKQLGYSDGDIREWMLARAARAIVQARKKAGDRPETKAEEAASEAPVTLSLRVDEWKIVPGIDETDPPVIVLHFKNRPTPEQEQQLRAAGFKSKTGDDGVPKWRAAVTPDSANMAQAVGVRASQFTSGAVGKFAGAKGDAGVAGPVSTPEPSAVDDDDFGGAAEELPPATLDEAKAKAVSMGLPGKGFVALDGYLHLFHDGKVWNFARKADGTVDAEQDYASEEAKAEAEKLKEGQKAKKPEPGDKRDHVEELRSRLLAAVNHIHMSVDSAKIPETSRNMLLDDTPTREAVKAADRDELMRLSKVLDDVRESVAREVELAKKPAPAPAPAKPKAPTAEELAAAFKARMDAATAPKPKPRTAADLAAEFKARMDAATKGQG